MAEDRLKENQFDKVGVNPFNAPIPGESLTTTPDVPHSWERPPKYTEEDDCMEAVYMELTASGNLIRVIDMINEGTPLDEMAQVILYKGYTEGLWNPDLMLMLIEPTIYLLIAIADYADIDDYVLYEGEDVDPEAQIPDDDVEPIMMDDDEPKEQTPRVQEPTEEVVGQSLLSKIKTELPGKVTEAKENK